MRASHVVSLKRCCTANISTSLIFFSETALLARYIPLYQGKNSFLTDLGEKTVEGMHFIVWIAEGGRGEGLPQRASHLVSLCALIEYHTPQYSTVIQAGVPGGT